ncbi:rRNA-processing protein EBP2 [Marasmius tenuissimus]|uniref:rRNA-processing protein EBP2 n=1 Tax=Marasmius tenuissimus TaxID=585030 RepID=A0ABR3A8X1_9AGAR
MSQPMQTTRSQFDVSTAVDNLKSRFMREWLRDPVEDEIILWNNSNESLTCRNCSQAKARCTTSGPGSLPCTRCTTLNTQQICTRVIEERRTRVKSIMNLDEDTLVALQGACFHTRSPPQPQPNSNTIGTNRDVHPRTVWDPPTPAPSIPSMTYGHRQRSPSPSSSDFSRHTTPTPSLPSIRHSIPRPPFAPPSRSANTPEIIDLTGDSEATAIAPHARPPSPRQHYTPPVREPRPNYGSVRHNSASATHSRLNSYPPGSAFGVFASGHSAPPSFRHSFPSSSSSGSLSLLPTGRRQSFESQLPAASPLYMPPPPPASAPVASMASSYPSSPRGPPPLTAPSPRAGSLHSPFSSPEDAFPRQSREVPMSFVQQESEKIRQVTAMLAQRNSQIRVLSERYPLSEGATNPVGDSRRKREDHQEYMVDERGARDLVARLEDELDRSRNLNQRLIQHNEELRSTQRDMDALRHAYRDLLQKNETLERQRTGTPVQMMRHMRLSEPGRDVRDVNLHEMGIEDRHEDCAIHVVRRDLQDALRELSVAKEALNDRTAARYDLALSSSLQGEHSGSSVPKNYADQDSQTRRAIEEYTNFKHLIRSLTQARSDFFSGRISKTDMLDAIDRMEKQLDQMARRFLEDLPNKYEGFVEALGTERNGNGNLIQMSGVIQGSGGNGGTRLSSLHGPGSPSNAVGPISPSSGGSGSLSPETRLKRRRIEDIMGEESE